MKKDPVIFLLHILESVELVEKYLSGIEEKEFLKSLILQDSVARRLEIIGEAVAHLTPGFRKKYVKVDWKTIKNMRNLLIHEYFGVNLKVVWNTAKYDLPKLRREIEKIVESNKQSILKV